MPKNGLLDRPVFIVGPHRSGTTLLYRILVEHPEVGHLNRANHRFPGRPRFARLLTRLGSTDQPREAQRFWDRFWDGTDDVLGREDADPRTTAWFRGRLATVLRLRRATRLVAKYPRLSLRLPWLDEVFPGCVVLHVVRDWRAVVNSTLARKLKREDREGGWFGVRVPGWREMGELPHELASGRIFRTVTLALERDGAALGERYAKVGYEDLCADPVAVVRRTAEICGLPFTPAFEASIPRDLKSANYKWRERLGEEAVGRIRGEDPEFYDRFAFGD